MENDKPPPIDAEVSKTKAYGGGLGNYTEERSETDNAVRAAESIIKSSQPRENFVRRFMKRIQGR